MNTTLLVCSGGGHLKQLYTLAKRFGIPPEEQLWVTFENGLSKSLLADREVQFVPFAAPRDAVNISRIALAARKLFKQRTITQAISTGSSPAVAFLPQAARLGIPSHYIESAARADGPSVSGRIVSRWRQIATYTQYPAWANDRWAFHGSIFDSFVPGPQLSIAKPIRKIVVTVGTQDGYRFDRLYAHLAPLLQDAEVLWQTGPQDVRAFGITDARPSVPYAELATAVAEADVVIAHAGTGSALTAIEANKCPVLVPRLKAHGEHVDDHQLQIASELERRGLAIQVRAEDLGAEVLQAASVRSIQRIEPGPFVLGGSQLEAA